ncbi:uncharacterized protein LOC134279373 isoform X2 [Saccostrea cucullata]|uniref:uncharacterized protein LOC134279373 isoform X2 n=1 Tax=Saccostrea cuccullata TaxID=36930 RepID=UPI002ED0FB96
MNTSTASTEEGKHFFLVSRNINLSLIRIYKEAVTEKGLPKLKMDVLFFVIFLCVVHLAVTNDPNMSNMCGTGICCSGYFFKDNICTECPPGTYGHNCSEECSEGRYGRKCKEKCPEECARSCNKITGTCLDNAESYSEETPHLKNISFIEPDTNTNNTNISIEKKIEDFLKDKLWIIAGTSCLLVVISCSCVGLFFLCKVCKGKRKTNEALDYVTPSNQNQHSTYSERYEDLDNNTSTNPILPPRAKNCKGTTSTTDKNYTDKPEVVYSKPKPKKRYSLVRKLKVSQELTSPEEDFDSDEFDDYTDTSGGVEISGIPMNQSFKTFRSSGISKQNRKRKSTNYGRIW